MMHMISINLKIYIQIKKQMKIAFGYKMGAGKDEAVSYLIRKVGGKHISFASPIYDIMKYAQTRCGFKLEKDRKFLQYIGTEWGRSKEDKIWIRLALEESENNGNTFLSDLRYPNELEALKSEGWTCVKLIRSHQEDRKGTGDHIHTSETALDNIPDEEWDYIIHNDGTLKEFYDKLYIMIYEKFGKLIS
jgi:hypothetical protein